MIELGLVMCVGGLMVVTGKIDERMRNVWVRKNFDTVSSK